MAYPLGNAALAAYGLAGRAMLPFLPAALKRRARKGKEDRERLGERFGRASLPRPAGRLAWVHAASVGETNAVLPLVGRLAEAGYSVVFTSVTVTSAGIAKVRLPAQALHQFAPLDVAPAIRRFLEHWRPDIAIFVESEIWPTTVAALSSAGIPQVLVNARLSERSYRGWARFAAVAGAVFGRLTLCLAQSDEDAGRYRRLGAPRVAVTGNLKFDAPPPAADDAALAIYRAAIGDRPTWLAASTHPGEEAIAASVHRVLSRRFPDLLTAIVPRHPDRGEAIRDEIGAADGPVALRSRGDPLTPSTGLYVADTLGELGLFYRAAPVAFLGGSLTPRGGQNPIEALQLGCAVLHGPDTGNFAEIYAAIDAAAPLSAVSDADMLAGRLASFLADRGSAAHLARVAADALKPFSGALMATMTALDPYLRKGSPA